MKKELAVERRRGRRRPSDRLDSDAPFGKKLKRLCYRQRILPLEVGRAVLAAHGLPDDAVAACRTAIMLERGECPPAMDPLIVGRALRKLLGTTRLGDPPGPPQSMARATPVAPGTEGAEDAEWAERSHVRVTPVPETSHVRQSPVDPGEYAPSDEQSWKPGDVRSTATIRTAWMTVELTRSELQRIRRAAAAVGAKPEDYVRDTALVEVTRQESRRRVTPFPR